MAFPPNYRQERNNRNRAKQQKANEKQAEREARSNERKQKLADAGHTTAPADGSKSETSGTE